MANSLQEERHTRISAAWITENIADTCGLPFYFLFCIQTIHFYFGRISFNVRYVPAIIFHE
jgi:hypothetical protein